MRLAPLFSPTFDRWLSWPLYAAAWLMPLALAWMTRTAWLPYARVALELEIV